MPVSERVFIFCLACVLFLDLKSVCLYYQEKISNKLASFKFTVVSSQKVHF